MPKFNVSTTTTVENLAGGESYDQSPKYKLASLVLTSFVKDQYYRSESEGLSDIRKLVGQIKDKVWIARLACYARNVFGMRSVSHVLISELVHATKGHPIRQYVNKVIRRPDDMTEIISYYLSAFGKPLPTRLKAPIADALTRFDEYSLAKYRSSDKKVSLVDVVNLVHPKHTDQIGKLVNGTLKSFDTWEVEVSAAGSDPELKNKTWENLVKENKLKHFALLRNLRNIEMHAPNVLDMALLQLQDELSIKKSLVLPFRYATAYAQLKEDGASGKVLSAISKACDIACNNVPELSGTTLVALDVSGSMQGKPSQIGSVFAAILLKANNADLMTFDGTATYRPVNPDDSTLTIAESIKFQGGSTNFSSIFQTANKAYDRVIILSDMQSWVNYHSPKEAFKDYKKQTGANPKIFSFDLAGYGTLEFPEKGVYQLAGFSDKVFDVMALLEKDQNALIGEINNYRG